MTPDSQRIQQRLGKALHLCVGQRRLSLLVEVDRLSQGEAGDYHGFEGLWQGVGVSSLPEQLWCHALQQGEEPPLPERIAAVHKFVGASHESAFNRSLWVSHTISWNLPPLCWCIPWKPPSTVPCEDHHCLWIPPPLCWCIPWNPVSTSHVNTTTIGRKPPAQKKKKKKKKKKTKKTMMLSVVVASFHHHRR